MTFKSIMAMALVCMAFTIAATSTFGAADPLDALAPKSLVSRGNPARLYRVFEEAIVGRHITVGVLGGSITEGAAATKSEYRYGNLVGRWFAKTFPKAKVSLVNAGIGATGTYFGCLRVQRDLLSEHPDFVIVEFAVNDGLIKSYSETYEGVIRQILSAPNHPAVVELFLIFGHRGVTAEVPEEKIGLYYGLPMISYRNAVWPLLRTKKLAWNAIQSLSFPGNFHPNDRGHALIAYFVTNFLRQCLGDYLTYTHRFVDPAHPHIPPIKPLPRPLYTDVFEHTRLLNAKDIHVVTQHGWRLNTTAHLWGPLSIQPPGYWSSDKPGSKIAFRLRGRAILLSYYLHGRGYGEIRVRVDNRPPQIIDGWFPGRGGSRHTIILTTKLHPGVHAVEVTLLKAQAAKSTGHRFRILAFGEAGVLGTP